jgi:hypothetical protein
MGIEEAMKIGPNPEQLSKETPSASDRNETGDAMTVVPAHHQVEQVESERARLRQRPRLAAMRR